MRKITLLLLIVVATHAGAQIINVPADYPTIQQGINAAQPGDTVLVADGTYYEQVNITSKKPLVVASNFIMDGDSTHLYNTIIDGSQLQGNNRSVVVLSYVDTTTVLAGFTIQKGGGTLEGGALHGGGILVRYSGAKIIHNRIIDNVLDGGPPPSGQNCNTAGAAIHSASSTSMIILSDNLIEENICRSNLSYAYGAGGYIRNNVNFTNNIVTSNQCITTGNALSEGAGFCVDGVNPVTFNAINNKFYSNHSQSEVYALGGGLLAVRSVNYIASNQFFNNHSEAPNNSYGAGITLSVTYLVSVIENNLFKGNQARIGSALNLSFDYEVTDTVIITNNTFIENAGYKGGAIYTANGTMILENNVFNKNISQTYGGALYLDKSGDAVNTARIVNNSFSGNAASQGGAICSYKTNPYLLNNIFWDNYAPVGPDISVISGEASMAYCNIDASMLDGNVNILHCVFYMDPLFCDTTCLAISCDSPCKNSGTSDYTFGTTTVYAPTYDNMGKPRPLEEVFDIGAHEFDSTLVHRTDSFRNADFSIYPNPAENMIYCLYRLEKDANVFFNLYDLTGKALINWQTHLNAGEHTVPLQLKELPAGIYLLKLQSGDKMATRKVIKQTPNH